MTEMRVVDISTLNLPPRKPNLRVVKLDEINLPTRPSVVKSNLVEQLIRDYPHILITQDDLAVNSNSDSIRYARDLASSVPGEWILKNLNITKYKRTKNWLNFLCPFHKDTKPSAGVGVVNGNFNCYSCDLKMPGFEFWARLKGASRPLEGEYYIKVLSAFLDAFGIESPVETRA